MMESKSRATNHSVNGSTVEPRSGDNAPGRTSDGARIQQRGTDQVRRVARAKLWHRFGAIAFERPRADMHSQRALLVGAAFADEVQDLALAPCQGLLGGARWKHHARRAAVPAVAAPRLPSGVAA